MTKKGLEQLVITSPKKIYNSLLFVFVNNVFEWILILHRVNNFFCPLPQYFNFTETESWALIIRSLSGQYLNSLVASEVLQCKPTMAIAADLGYCLHTMSTYEKFNSLRNTSLPKFSNQNMNTWYLSNGLANEILQPAINRNLKAQNLNKVNVNQTIKTHNSTS